MKKIARRRNETFSRLHRARRNPTRSIRRTAPPEIARTCPCICIGFSIEQNRTKCSQGIVISTSYRLLRPAESPPSPKSSMQQEGPNGREKFVSSWLTLEESLSTVPPPALAPGVGAGRATKKRSHTESGSPMRPERELGQRHPDPRPQAQTPPNRAGETCSQ